MAYNDTPMKVQWITVGGQQVPAFRPQYWDEDIEDWRVSSRLKPLPVIDKDVLDELQTLNGQQEQIDDKIQQLVSGQGVTTVENFPETQAVSGSVEVTNQPEDFPDSAVRSELESIKQTQAEILDRLDGTFDTQLTGSNTEYVGYSDETKPVGEKRDSFLELDTKDLYIHDGNNWVVF